jgi:hypothetical protein
MNMSSDSPTHTSAKPSGTGLLVLGLLSLVFGPFTAVPGLILSKRFRPFTAAAAVGYFLCWFFLVFSILALILMLLKNQVR